MAAAENQKRNRSSPARSPHPQQTDPPTRLARSPTKRKGEARSTHLGSREELVRRRGGGGGGVAPAAVPVPVHPLLVALQREAPQLPQRRLHVLAPRTRVRAGAGSSPRSPAAGRRCARGNPSGASSPARTLPLTSWRGSEREWGNGEFFFPPFGARVRRVLLRWWCALSLLPLPRPAHCFNVPLIN